MKIKYKLNSNKPCWKALRDTLKMGPFGPSIALNALLTLVNLDLHSNLTRWVLGL